MGRKREGYTAAPWTFKGRALYQLNLVKVEEARKHIPSNLHIVSFFGYTIGGFYLARYDDSPVGAFDECVALAGIVWNKPTSCAWASRVYVTDREARDHGRDHVGLPSRHCLVTQVTAKESSSPPSWWDQARSGGTTGGLKAASKDAGQIDDAVVLTEPGPSTRWRIWRKLGGHSSAPVCKFSGFPSGIGRKGPRLRLKLPSFSGLTKEQPDMLHYTCQIDCRLRAIKPVRVGLPGQQANSDESTALDKEKKRFVEMIGGRPVMAIAFDDMEMTVQEPRVLLEGLTAASSWEIGSQAPSLVAA